MSKAEATAAAIGGVVASSSFEAALLVSAWANETGRELEDWQFDAYQALVAGNGGCTTRETMMAYENTEVSVEKSQGDLRKLLTKYGADRFTFGESVDLEDVRWAGVEFTHDGHLVRMVAPLKPPDEKWVRGKVQRARSKTREDFVAEHHEQEARRIWRVVFWSLKSRLVAIEEGVETFEQAFLAHLVDPASDRTLWQHIAPSVEAGTLKIGGRGLPALTAGSYDEDVVEAELVDE